jgi:hypothetical protein
VADVALDGHMPAACLTTAYTVARPSTNKQATRRLHGAETDFEREFGAILTQPVKFKSGSHGPELCVAHETCAVSDMLSPKPFGYQRLNRLVEEF